MKTSHSHRFAAGASALLFSSLFTLTTFAGPSPQFWTQQQRARTNAVAATKTAASPTRVSAMHCASCQDSIVTEQRSSAAGGKVAARSDRVGSTHTCSMCGGAITTVRGHSSNTMTGHCPACATTDGAGCKAV